jgi:hypothetical protein
MRAKTFFATQPARSEIPVLARSRPIGAEDPTAASPEPSFWTRRRLVLAVFALTMVHLALAISSLLQENPTVDEVLHLPAGVSYWQTGRFSMYRHNPPLFKLVAAVPVLFSGAVTDPLYESVYWHTDPPNKTGFGHEFALLNARDYFELFARSRLLMPLFSVLGGLAVFFWSRRLYGPNGGLLSLALWCFCPNILAHCRLITSDVSASALGLAATYLFVRYLHDPTWKRATWAGLMLGVVQVSKFSGLLLYAIWPLIALVFALVVWDRALFWRRGLPRLMVHGLLMLGLSVLVINTTYRFDGFGRPLGQFAFLSHFLARDVEPPDLPFPPNPSLTDLVSRVRVNRFRGTVLESLPVPLPADYVLGFDDQKLEAEGVPRRAVDPQAAPGSITGYPVYLDGQLRDRSWWYYYLLALLYKVPEGTWLLVLLSVGTLLLGRRPRRDWSDEFAVWVVPTVVVLVMSVFTNINLGLRYVLPAFPFVYVGCGRLAIWSRGLAGRARAIGTGLMAACLVQSVISTVLIHPHYLAYFNRLSGGPERGSEHLIDSNLDWGQDLVNLKRWLDRNAPGERVGLAYFGQIPPVIFEARGQPFDWYLPPALPGGWDLNKTVPPRYLLEGFDTPPGPGLYAVSASLVRGLPWRVYDAPLPGRNPQTGWVPYEAQKYAFSYFQELEPVDKIGYSIFLYRVTPSQAERLAQRWRPASP